MATKPTDPIQLTHRLFDGRVFRFRGIPAAARKAGTAGAGRRIEDHRGRTAVARSIRLSQVARHLWVQYFVGRYSFGRRRGQYCARDRPCVRSTGNFLRGGRPTGRRLCDVARRLQGGRGKRFRDSHV